MPRTKKVPKKNHKKSKTIIKKTSPHGNVEYKIKVGDDDTKFTVAAREGHIEAVKWLIEKGADVNQADNEGLQHAAEAGHLAMVKLLVQHGADVFAVDMNRVMGLGKGNEHSNIVDFLMDEGGQIDPPEHYWSGFVFSGDFPF